jgi:hypothetical protein
LKGILKAFRKNLTDVREDVGAKELPKHSRLARLIVGASHVKDLFRQIETGIGPRIARPIPGAVVRDYAGRPYQYYTDGSLRHAMGGRSHLSGRQQRRRTKRGRRFLKTDAGARLRSEITRVVTTAPR